MNNLEHDKKIIGIDNNKYISYYFKVKEEKIYMLSESDEIFGCGAREEYDRKVEKGSLYLEVIEDEDTTAFSAYMGATVVYSNIREENVNKKFIFISELSADYIFSKASMIGYEKDINEFYQNKELQLKWNFIILHPICFEVDERNNKLIYRPLTGISDTVRQQMIRYEVNTVNITNYSIDMQEKRQDLENENKSIQEENNRFSQDTNELVIVIGNHKFRIYENVIKHFVDGIRLVEKVNIDKDKFYGFANYVVEITNEWKNFSTIVISPEAKWSIVIKTNNNGTKRYAGIDYCPNNWDEFWNAFNEFLGNKSNDNYTEENDTEEYISFTNFEKLSTDDDKVANYNLVCGIKFEKNYLNGLIEQTVLYELNEGNIFNFDDVVEIKKITPNEVVLRISDFVQLSKIAKVETEEPNKIDVTLKLNELVTGCSMKFVPSTVYYKIKVLYIRKKEISNSNLTK